MEFLQNYGLFLAKTVTVLLAFLIAVIVTVGLGSRSRSGARERLEVTRLNDRLDSFRHALEHKLLDRKTLRRLVKQRARTRKQAASRPRLFVLDFNGDLRASQVESLRQEISGILLVAGPDDEVLVRLQSGGGMVPNYGLAAAELARLKGRVRQLTIAIDRIAASGGYLMACIGQQILSAPFAVLGSIGVVAQLPNVHRLLKKHDVDVEVLTAGEYKRTLTVFGENTEKGREKFQEDLEATHALFKDFVARHRPQLDIERVATGEIWLGQDALGLQLVDRLATSDQYLAERAAEADLVHLHYAQRKSLPERFGLAAQAAADRFLLSWWGRLNQQRFW